MFRKPYLGSASFWFRANQNGVNMKRHFLCAVAVSLTLALCLTGSSSVLAGDSTEQAGTILLYVLATAAVGTTAIKHDGEGTLQYGKSLVLSTSVTQALKYTINEDRPNGGNHSFPSEHTSFSFTSAEFMRKRYGCEYGLPAYAVASFVGYSRVESDNHYWHDVFAGAAIGIASSYLFTETHQGVTVSAEADQHFVGVLLSRSW